MKTNIFLFDSNEAAQEVAYCLGGKWDNCNGIELVNWDDAALELAASLHDAEYCQVGEVCEIVRDHYARAEDDEYQQVMLKVISDIITEKLRSKIVTVGQKPELFFS